MTSGQLTKRRLGPRIEEALAVEAMNASWRHFGDARRAEATGAGHGPDVTIRLSGIVVGTGEISIDDDPSVRKGRAELSRLDYQLPLPAGSGQWLIDLAPGVLPQRLRVQLPGIIGRLRHAGIDELHVTEVDVAVAQARVKRGLPPKAAWDDLYLISNRLHIRAIYGTPNASRDVAWLTTSGGGSSGGDGAVVAEFAEGAVRREPHAQNVAKLLKRPGQRHVGVLLGSWTRENRWDVFHPIAWGSGFDRPPIDPPQLPDGLDDVWVIHVWTGWAAWYHRGGGWLLIDGDQDWWRRQTHLESVRLTLEARGESA